MDDTSITKSEPLTATMISALRAEAGSAGDMDTVSICDTAATGDTGARCQVAEMITDARAMDDSRPLVVVMSPHTDISADGLQNR